MDIRLRESVASLLPGAQPSTPESWLHSVSGTAAHTRFSRVERLARPAIPLFARCDLLPLDGYTVVSLEHAVAAPFATRQLADLGARVIKVERPLLGDFARHYDHTVQGEGSYFVWLNRGKESIELDIKAPEDRALLDRLIAEADVFVQNLVPGAVERLGLDATTLRSANPSLVHCSISGYGAEGPYRSKKAYDLLVQCESGLVNTTGSADYEAKVGISVVDRSEERRVGKECRSRWSPYHSKKRKVQ